MISQKQDQEDSTLIMSYYGNVDFYESLIYFLEKTKIEVGNFLEKMKEKVKHKEDIKELETKAQEILLKINDDTDNLNIIINEKRPIFTIENATDDFKDTKERKEFYNKEILKNIIYYNMNIFKNKIKLKKIITELINKNPDNKSGYEKLEEKYKISKFKEGKITKTMIKLKTPCYISLANAQKYLIINYDNSFYIIDWLENGYGYNLKGNLDKILPQKLEA
jgi:hypothetical protein